jgi:hypothetical protein
VPDSEGGCGEEHFAIEICEGSHSDIIDVMARMQDRASVELSKITDEFCCSNNVACKMMSNESMSRLLDCGGHAMARWKQRGFEMEK